MNSNKVNINNTHSPCQLCMTHGHLYSSNSETCQKCEYNIAIVILKEVLKSNESCWLCKNVEHIKGGFYECNLGYESWHDCDSYTIDWNAIIEDYELEDLVK